VVSTPTPDTRVLALEDGAPPTPPAFLSQDVRSVRLVGPADSVSLRTTRLWPPEALVGGHLADFDDGATLPSPALFLFGHSGLISWRAYAVSIPPSGRYGWQIPSNDD
jgi:hypothetical protein